MALRGKPTFVHIGPHQGFRRSQSRLAQGYLCIEHAVTLRTGLLARPHLERRWPERFAEPPNPWA